MPESGGNQNEQSAVLQQHWVQRRRQQLDGSAPEADPELRAARKRIRELEMENAFLKKAAAFFAKDQA